MKKNLILIIFFVLLSNLFAQIKTEEDQTSQYTICLYRENRKEGKLAKQEVFIDSISYLKIGNKSRAIFDINTSIGDTLSFKIYYSSLGQKREKEIQIPAIMNFDTIYIKSFFYAESYNPIKHYGTGKNPEFSVDAIIMDKEDGKKKFDDDDYFKDRDRKKIKKICVDINTH